MKNSRPNTDEELLGEDPDDGVEAAPTPSDDELKSVRDLAARYVQLEDEIADLGKQLADKQLALKAIREGSLPLALTTVGMKEFEMVGGGKVSIETMTAASIAKERQGEAFPALEAAGLGSIVKHEIKILFGKGEEAWARKFLLDLSKRKKPVNFKRRDFVEPQTLLATARALLKGERAKGLDPKTSLTVLLDPKDAGSSRNLYELLGIFELKYAEVERPKP